MSLIDGVRYRLKVLLFARRTEREREDEMQFHLERDAAQTAHVTGDAESAKHAARRVLGNATLIREEVRLLGAQRWVDAAMQDLRFAWRVLLRSRVFALFAVLSIAIGIAANTVVFSVIDELLLSRLPVANPHELREVWRADSLGEREPYFTLAEAERLHAAVGSEIASHTYLSTTSAELGGESFNRLSFDAVDGSFFSLLGIRPAAGRLIDESDDRDGALVVVFSFDEAVRYFGSPKAAIGQHIRLQHHEFTVIGVTPKRFDGVVVAERMTLVVPQGTRPLLRNTWNPTDGTELVLITRFGADSSRTQTRISRAFEDCCANGERAMNRWKTALQRLAFTDVSSGVSVGKFDVRSMFSHALYAIMVGVGLVLLIACLNVGGLLLSRASTRSREIAVRMSLGASRSRIVRQLFVESVLLSLLGTAIGLVLAAWGTALIARSLPGNLQVIEQYVRITPNTAMFSFVAFASCVCVMIFGIGPAVRATAFDPVVGLRSGAPTTSSRSLGRGVIAGQIGLALLLVYVAGLFAATLRNLESGLGMAAPERLLVAELEVAGTAIPPSAIRQTYDDVGARLREIPGVQSIAGADVLPLIYRGFTTRVLDIPGSERGADRDLETGVIRTTPAFFATTGSNLIAGREFNDGDVLGTAPVIIINETVAREFFPDRSPIGQTIRFREGAGAATVVGVARNVKQGDLHDPPARTVYLPRSQAATDGDRFIFALRATGSASNLVPIVRRAIAAAAPEVVIRHVQPMSSYVGFQLGRERVLLIGGIAFALIAVTLAAVGLYGVMALYVRSRQREIGVRMAFGATRARVVRMVIEESLRIALAGVAMGAASAMVVSKVAHAAFQGTAPLNLVTLLAAIGAVTLVCVAAALVPSCQASSIEPLGAIRAE